MLDFWADGQLLASALVIPYRSQSMHICLPPRADKMPAFNHQSQHHVYCQSKLDRMHHFCAVFKAHILSLLSIQTLGMWRTYNAMKHVPLCCLGVAGVKAVDLNSLDCLSLCCLFRLGSGLWRRRNALKHLPGPKHDPVLGFWALLMRKDMHRFATELAEQYGPIFKFRLLWYHVWAPL
jgi:hypothetical protein